MIGAVGYERREQRLALPPVPLVPRTARAQRNPPRMVVGDDARSRSDRQIRENHSHAVRGAFTTLIACPPIANQDLQVKTPRAYM